MQSIRDMDPCIFTLCVRWGSVLLCCHPCCKVVSVSLLQTNVARFVARGIVQAIITIVTVSWHFRHCCCQWPTASSSCWLMLIVVWHEHSTHVFVTQMDFHMHSSLLFFHDFGRPTPSCRSHVIGRQVLASSCSSLTHRLRWNEAAHQVLLVCFVVSRPAFFLVLLAHIQIDPHLFVHIWCQDVARIDF